MSEGSVYDDWEPRAYLGEYYRELQQDERSTMRFFVEGMRQAPEGPALCFGCGPTLHHVFLTVPRATEVVLADYLPANLEEIRRWQDGEPGAHDWTPFVRYTLESEGAASADPDVAARMGLLRARIARLVHADASLADPLGPEFRGRFAAVLSPYCAEAATADKAEWVRYCRNIATLVRPGGLFMTSAVRRCHRYRAGNRFFPTAFIDEDDMRAVLEQDFAPGTIEVRGHDVPDHEAQGFSGIVLARAVKPR